MTNSTPLFCETVRFVTPRDRYLLDGMVYGQPGGETAYIWLHGLESSAFGKHSILGPLAGDSVQALYFSNRGHDALAGIKRVEDTPKGYSWAEGGAAKELFTDCTDDIQGAVDFMKTRGAKQIILVGHSTGCQKSAYYLAQPEADAAVAGAVLVCPVSDYAAVKATTPAADLERATAEAHRLVEAGQPMELLASSIWSEVMSAQRFLSLYTPDSIEEIFPYAQPAKAPETLNRARRPMLAIIAGADEYLDRPAQELAAWFKDNLKPAGSDAVVVEGSLHNLNGFEAEISKQISHWRQRVAGGAA